METKTHDVQQGTDDWFKIKELMLSASNAQAIANNGAGLKTLVLDLVSEYLSESKKEHFSSADTDRGNELEPIARGLYSLETGNKVTEVGFIEWVGHNAGCSPDGLIGDDGGLEIKCPNDTKFFKLLIGEDTPDTKYLWQVQMSLLITQRKWWDLVFYNPNFSKNMLIFKNEPEQEKQEALLKGIEAGGELIKKYLNEYKNYETNTIL